MLNAENIKKFAVILLIASSLIWLFFKESNNEPSADTDINAETEADSFITGAHFIEFGLNGKPNVTLVSSEAKQYSQYDRVIFSNPDLLMLDDAGTPWHMTAHSGRYNTAKEFMELKDDVKVDRYASTTIDLTMTTQALSIDKNQKYLTSDEEVNFVTPESQLKGTGMQAWINEKKVLLNSRVEGVYFPQKSQTAPTTITEQP